MSKTVAIANHKGGVGKTATAAALGAILASKGYKVLLVDLDAQANLTASLLRNEPKASIYGSLLGKEPMPVERVKDNLCIAPSSLDLAAIELEIASAMSREYILKDLLEPVASDYDFILLDCAPSLGLLTINAFVAADEVLIPLSAEPLPYKGLGKILNFIELTKRRLNPSLSINGIVITRWERSNITSKIEEGIRAQFADKVYSSKIRKNIAIAEATLTGEDIVTYAPNSNGAEDYRTLAEEFVARCGAAQ